MAFVVICSGTGTWHLGGRPDWDSGPRLLHVRSLDEPNGSILVRHPDGTVETVHWPAASGR